MKKLVNLSIILAMLLVFLPQSTAIAEVTPLGQQLPGDESIAGPNLEIQQVCYDHVMVKNLNDSGPDSLRQAIIDVCPGRAISFEPSLSGMITLSSHIRINKSLTIIGLGADILTISGGQVPHYSSTPEGGDVGGVFWLQGEYAPDVQPITVNISGLTIQDGRAREGGAVYNHSRSTLVLSDCVIGPNNQAIESGGGISNKYGSVTLNRCTIWGNSQIAQPGYDLLGGGGIVTYNSPASTTLINSTVSGNSADTYGGGIFAGSGSVVTLVHTTVTENKANEDFTTAPSGGGGGIFNSNSTVSLQNSIVAGNLDFTVLTPTSHPKWPDVSGAFTTLGGNLIGDGTGSTNTWPTTDKVGTATMPINAKLDELWKNDPGRTLTHTLSTDSPAIDSSTCLVEVPFDQRGVTRPNSGTACDIGAYEVGSPTALTILPETIPAGEYGSAYIQHFSVIGTNKAVTWSWVQVDSQLVSSCDFNWPYVGGIMCYQGDDYLLPVDSYTFTAVVTEDGSTLTGSRTYTFVIYPRLTFSPSTLLIGRLGQDYNQPITVTGGASPYTLTLLSGTLPIGLTFNESTDAITGTPTEAGTLSYLVIKAEDANGVTKSKTYSLTILPEHLFTWLPDSPTSYQPTTFTAVSGFDHYVWSYDNDDDGVCEKSVLGFVYTSTWTFYGKGTYKVCLTVYKNVPFQEFSDERMVTVTNYPPSIDGLDIDPYRSFPEQLVETTVYFGDVDGDGTFTCTIDWGDGSPPEAGTFDSENWECAFPPHAYIDADTYTITATVVDDEEAFDTYDGTHEVLHLYAESYDTWLASNVHPTTVTLYGYAPLGTETMQFNIASDPTHGSFGDPTFLDCRPDNYRPAAECRATVKFTPTVTEPPYKGSDQFTYTVSKDTHISAPDDVNLWLDENIEPTAEDSSATVLATKPSQFAIFGKDLDESDYNIDMVSFYIDSPPSHGSLSFDDDPDVYDWLESGARWYQMLTYTPKDGTVATSDTFKFHVNDTHQDSPSATVTLNLYTPTTLHVNVNDDVVDTSGCDGTHCSLREAVMDAKNGDTIDFTLDLPDTITLTRASGGELVIDKNIQILGPGADQLTISAGFMDPEMNPSDGFRVIRVYTQEWPIEAAISGLTIRDGRAGEGGGVYVDYEATLDLKDCVIGPNNIVAVAGGGISVRGELLTMENCTVVGNHGTGSEGGAGIFAQRSDLIIINSTITGNVTNNFGGGILASNGANVSLIHSTISGNTANQDSADFAWGGGGGIHNMDAKKVELWNTIVAGNTDLTNPSDPEGHVKWPDVYGRITSLGGNLIGNPTGSTGWLPSDLKGDATTPLDPLLGDLAVYDPGTTPIFPLLIGSQAIDAVECATGVATDQRGVTRPQGSACDIGAFELVLGELKITKVFNPLSSGFTDTFAINYDCDDGTAHDGTVNLAAGGSETISGIPTGTVCAISEPALPTAPTGWTFGTPTFNPLTGSVTISDTIVEVIVTNAISQDVAPSYNIFLPLVLR